jgi:hypothetical protein
MSEMKRAGAREANQRRQDRFASTLVIAAAIIDAVRVARDENISRPSSRLHTVIGRLGERTGFHEHALDLRRLFSVPHQMSVSSNLDQQIQGFKKGEMHERPKEMCQPSVHLYPAQPRKILWHAL